MAKKKKKITAKEYMAALKKKSAKRGAKKTGKGRSKKKK